jgi:cytochrome bd-type quinol oxidase subunit 2
MVDPWAVVPFGLALMFAIWNGVELGLPLAGFMRDRSAKQADGGQMLLHWSGTTTLLIMTFVTAVAVFPVLFPLSMTILQPLIVMVFALLTAQAMLLLGHSKLHKHNAEAWQTVMTLVSLALPVVLIQVVTILITGEPQFWIYPTIAISLGLLAVVLSIALWSGYYYRPGKTTRAIARSSFWWSTMAAAVGLPLAFSLDPGLLADQNLVFYFWPLWVGAPIAILCLMNPVRRRYFVASCVLVVSVGAALLGLLLSVLV